MPDFLVVNNINVMNEIGLKAYSSDLSAYALTPYVFTSALFSYVLTSALTTALSPYVLTSSLSSYVLSSGLTTALTSYLKLDANNRLSVPQLVLTSVSTGIPKLTTKNRVLV